MSLRQLEGAETLVMQAKTFFVGYHCNEAETKMKVMLQFPFWPPRAESSGGLILRTSLEQKHHMCTKIITTKFLAFVEMVTADARTLRALSIHRGSHYANYCFH